MRKKFTILTTALALLAMLAVPKGGWGQTRSTSSLVFTAACGGSGTADDGAVWTVTSDGTESSFDSNKGIHYGTSSAQVQYINLSTSDISGNITKVVVNASTASGVTATVGVTVGGAAFGVDPQSLSTTATDYTFEGSASGEIVVLITKPSKATKALYCKSIVVTYTASGGTTHTISAVSNNNSYGTVSLSGTTITATPNSGYRVIAGEGGYTVTSGTATVTNNGDNTFSVTATSDCTVQINFEAIPTHTATFSVNGTTTTQDFAEGATITFPADPANIGNKAFVGWVTAPIEGTTNTAPDFVNTATTTMGDNDVTYYAVFALANASGDPVETLNQTLEYDTWTYYGATSNQNTYRLFGNGSYVVSDAFDLSKLSKVIVYGGTYGDSGNNSLTIGDGTNTWADVTVSGNSQYGVNTYTEGDALSGTNPLRITSTCGNGSSGGVRISKVEIFTTEPSIVYSNYCTTVLYVATPTFSPAGGTFQEAQSVTIACTTDDATIQYKLTENGEWQNYSEAIHVSTTTTIWAKATKTGMDDSQIASATYTIQYILTVDIDDVVEYFLFNYHDGIWDEITLDDEGHALVASGADVRISGGEVFDDCYEVESFDVTDGINSIEVNYLSESDEYSFIMPESNSTLSATVNEIADHYILTVEGLGHVSIEMLVGSMSSVISLNANHQASICQGSEVTISELTVGNGFALQSVQLDGEELTKTDGVYTFEMPSNNATLTFMTESLNAPYYMLHTGALEEGDYLIVYDGAAMNNTVNGDRLQYESVTISDNTIITENATIVWHIAQNGDYWTIYSSAAYAYAAGTGAKNKAQMLADGNDDKAKWTVTGTQTYEFVNKANAAAGVNANLRRNGTYGFACYATSTGDALSLYKKVTPSNYTVEIEPNKWHFIASPTSTSPVNVDALSDLYYYDEQDHFWRNAKVFANANGFLNFDLGKGYLCANASNEPEPSSVTLTFTGVSTASGTHQITLDYHANTSEGEENTLAGWNLVGNPFAQTAYITKPFYTINAAGDEIVAGEGNSIDAMQGIFVGVTTDGETMTFSTEAPAGINAGQIVANVTRNRGNVIDRAILRFGESNTLPKFMLNPENTKLYIPQNGKDFAIVSAEGQGEMPVNFRAAQDGTYTLTVNLEGVEMNYLHLIDNMTGNDVDLLATPSYSFNATIRDYESRFRLVFAANNENGVSAGSTTFAYFSNGNLVVNNEGNATLQVVDVMGRIVKSESINGSASINVNAAPGVYTLRLVNGNDVKTQKVVVR